MQFVKGQLVRSLAGRDKGHTFAVLAVEGQILLLADGPRRTLANPKRKKERHVAPTATVLQGECLAGDNQLKAAIEAFEGQAACVNA